MDPFDTPGQKPLEADDRFPSGAWRGFFNQSHVRPGRYEMDLQITFSEGRISGEGRDFVGSFRIAGKYDVGTGGCSWQKVYIHGHSVSYRGFNEGKGIWGAWQIPPNYRGGFHIWPSAWGTGGIRPLETEEELPLSDGLESTITVESDELVVTTGRLGG